MFPGWLQILLVVLLIILLFGRGKISDLMGDVAKGIRSFRKGLSEEDGEEVENTKAISDKSEEAGMTSATTTDEKEKSHS
ncbi:MAG: twin-arginine translocase TatA/TatE family subunit [Sphingomonadales bacterium]|jgi:sec-independent protein translocase protein TatA